MASETSTAPDTQATTDDLTNFYNSVVQITAYCHAAINTTLTYPDGDTPPDWFVTLNTNLVSAQTHAQTWLTTLQPDISSKVPQTIINYNTKFNNAVTDINTILNNASGDNLSPGDTRKVQLFLKALVGQLTKDKDTMAAVQTQLQGFLGTEHPPAGIMGDAANLTSGTNGAQKAVGLEESTINSINNQISLVQQQIQQDSKAAESSEIGLGVGIFVLVCAIALCVATGGAAAALVVGAVAVIGVGAAIATTVVYSKAVNADLQKLYNLQQELTSDQAFVSALQGITTSVQSLITANQAAQAAMSNILTTWDTLLSKTSAVLTDLEAAQSDKSAVSSLMLDVQDAQSAWAALSKYAQAMENNNVTIQPPAPSQANTAAA